MASGSSVKIRLSRRGRKKLALYDIVVAHVDSPRDGKFIEKLGVYNPNTNPATILFDEEKALKWVLNGAEPTDTVGRMLSYKGILIRKHLQIGVIKGAITQEVADARYAEWQKTKTDKIEGKKAGLAQKAVDSKKAKLDAEKLANAAKAKLVADKRKAASDALESVAVAAAQAAAATEEPVVEEVAAPVEEPKAAEPVATVEVPVEAEVVTPTETESPAKEDTEKAAE